MVKSIEIKGFDALTYEEASAAFKDAYAKLESGGVLEFTMVDFRWVVEQYRVYQDPKAVYEWLKEKDRCALWDQATVARELLFVGYHKVWSGWIDPMPRHKVFIKGLKWVPETPETIDSNNDISSQ